jgi:peptide/nickel transport system substrate-binding protein
VFAAEIPSIENGAVAADGMSVNWRLKRGVQWYDKQPFTADDVVIDDSDGALLFGLGVHGQYLFVNAEKLVVAKGCCPTGCPLDAAGDRH